MKKKASFLLGLLSCALLAGCTAWGPGMSLVAATMQLPCGARSCGTGSLALESSGDTKEGICSLKEKLPFGFQTEDANILPEQGQEEGATTSDEEELFDPVELILQNPQLPNGCEVTSLAMVLTAAGFPASPVELYEGGYLPIGSFRYSGAQRFGPSPEEVYVGDAASSTGGWYCFEGPILQAGDAWLSQSGGGGRMQTITGLTQEELGQYVQDGVPVIAWVTLGYAAPAYADSFRWTLPSGEEYIPYSNLHCVVLAGEENGQFRIADPIYGWQTVDQGTFWDSFDAMGRRAVVYTPG